jgi:hypothetical protein
MDGGGVEVVDEAERRWERRRRPEPSLRGVADDREDSRTEGMESPGKRMVGEDMLAKGSCENLTIY